jgi:hypothetical protein
VNANWPLKARHAVFKAFKTDSFLLVTPGGNIFTTADPAVSYQILSRDKEFPKATDIYKSIRIYGENGTCIFTHSGLIIFKNSQPKTSSVFWLVVALIHVFFTS